MGALGFGVFLVQVEMAEMGYFMECYGTSNCVERYYGGKKKEPCPGHDSSLFDVDKMAGKEHEMF